MMYYEEIVAVLCDSNKKPLRELDSHKMDNGRKTKVFLPFDSEYQILIKNNSDKRVKLRIDIDGSNVSGSGLIIGAHCNDYIERFVDIAKKFKFVKSTNEAVSDPTNLENGVIKIRCVKEKEATYGGIVIHEHHNHIYHDSWFNRPRPNWYNQETYYTSNLADRNIGGFTSLNASCLRSAEPTVQTVYTAQSAALESGATVEGDNSSQKFDSTFWRGDEDKEIVFTFNLFGSDAQDVERKKKLEEFMKLKQELGL